MSITDDSVMSTQTKGQNSYLVLIKNGFLVPKPVKLSLRASNCKHSGSASRVVALKFFALALILLCSTEIITAGSIKHHRVNMRVLSWSLSLKYMRNLGTPVCISSTAHIIQDTSFMDGSKQKCRGFSHTQATT